MLKKALVLSVLLMAPYGAQASSHEDPKSVVLNVFKTLIENPKWTKADFDRYVSKDYIQVADGNTLTYEQDYQHIKALWETCKSIKVIFHDMVVEGNKVATRHTAYAVKKDGSEIEADVMAIFEVKDGKLIRCNELTRMVKGQKEDADLGSRH